MKSTLFVCVCVCVKSHSNYYVQRSTVGVQTIWNDGAFGSTIYFDEVGWLHLERWMVKILCDIEMIFNGIFMNMAGGEHALLMMKPTFIHIQMNLFRQHVCWVAAAHLFACDNFMQFIIWQLSLKRFKFNYREPRGQFFFSRCFALRRSTCRLWWWKHPEWPMLMFWTFRQRSLCDFWMGGKISVFKVQCFSLGKTNWNRLLFVAFRRIFLQHFLFFLHYCSGFRVKIERILHFSVDFCYNFWLKIVVTICNLQRTIMLNCWQHN